MPAGQARQTLDPEEAVYLATGQSVHADAPASAYEPAPHAAQFEPPGAPWKLPAAQAAQADAPVVAA